MSLTDHSPPKRSLAAKLLRPKVAIPVMLVLGLLLTPMIIRQWNLRGVPDVGEPYISADLSTTEINELEESWRAYAEAYKFYSPPADETVWDSINVLEPRQLDPFFARSDLKNWLRENERFLEAWRLVTESSSFRRVTAGNRTRKSSADVEGLHKLMRMFDAQALLSENEDGPWAAWPWYLARLHTGARLSREGDLVVYYQGMIIFHAARKAIVDWSLHPDLTAAQLTHACREFAEVCEIMEGIRPILMGEFRHFETTLDTMIGLDREHETTWDRIQRYLAAETELSLRVLKIQYRNTVAALDGPLHEFKEASGPGTTTLLTNSHGEIVGATDLDVPAYIAGANRSLLIQSQVLSHIFMSRIGMDSVHTAAGVELNNQTLVVALALQAHFRNHGEFPATLSKLVPTIMTSIPPDPISGQPLLYRLDQQSAVVYSVSQNGVDDGGQIEPPYESGFSPGPPTPEPLDYGFLVRRPIEKPLIAPKPSLTTTPLPF